MIPRPLFSTLWQYSTNSTMADPGTRHWRWTVDHTQIALSTTDDDGNDRHADLATLTVGDEVAIRSTKTSGDWGLATIDASVDLTTWFRFDLTVTEVGSNVTDPSGNDLVLFDFWPAPSTSTSASWIDAADLTNALGGVVSSTDEQFVQDCVDAANSYAFRRRAEAGYNDLPDVVPGADAKMGTTLYCVALFRERGSVDSYASFEDFATGIVPQSTFGQVNRLLGVPKPCIDRPWTLDELLARPRVTPYRGIR